MKEITENDLETEPENMLLSLNQRNNCNKCEKPSRNNRESPRALRNSRLIIYKSSISLSRVNVQNAKKKEEDKVEEKQ